MSNQNLISQLSWRYATKHFDVNKKISKEVMETLKQTLVLTPSSFGLQPYKFLIIENLEVRKKLTPHSWNQTQIEECSHLVIFLAKKTIDEKYIDEFLSLTAKTRAISLESLQEYRLMMIANLINAKKDILNWASKQGYLALGNLLTSAALLKIDTCPMEGIEAEKYDEILKIDNSKYTTLCACALGFRSENDKYQNLAKVRFDQKIIIEEI